VIADGVVYVAGINGKIHAFGLPSAALAAEDDATKEH
jgi:hypothetical protein